MDKGLFLNWIDRSEYNYKCPDCNMSDELYWDMQEDVIPPRW